LVNVSFACLLACLLGGINYSVIPRI
jgi:hypothetical protein